MHSEASGGRMKRNAFGHLWLSDTPTNAILDVDQRNKMKMAYQVVWAVNINPHSSLIGANDQTAGFVNSGWRMKIIIITPVLEVLVHCGFLGNTLWI
jgi:hypothetical protein